jgi:hypothetical protein
MKNSNKILLTTILAILIIITGLIVGSRFLITNIPDRPMNYFDSEDFISKTLDMTDFSGIDVSGVWRLDIHQGNEYAITLHYPESESDQIDIYTWNSRLHLDNNMESRPHQTAFRASITMPELSSLRTEDGVSVTLYDFDCDELDIRIAGATEIEASGMRIETLKLRCDGAVDADFEDSEVVNADLDIRGASRVTLTMAGGELTGSASGAASILYYGTVSTQDIATAGAVSVRHR